jgi:ElaA protein
LNIDNLSWEWKSFSELNKDELYEILKFRQEIFVVEQKSWYLDADGLDKSSLHLLVSDNGNLIGYLRLTPPGNKYTETSIGRVSINEGYRGKRLGDHLLTMGIEKGKEVYGSRPCRISAQEYLIAYYENHGFKVQGNPYDEDGISHVEMLLDG